MSSADTVARIFDQARDATLGMADELNRAIEDNARLNEILNSHEITIESLRRSQELDGKLIEDLTERNRKLERLNAVFHSRADLIVDIIKRDGGELFANSKVSPDQIFNPAGIPDAEDRLPGGYVEQMNKEISHTAQRSGLAEAAETSSETVKP